uniref:Uncharacterized protein n=1 Tax=Romanomermis culicivorax TaxID=13658 RepID=A0A915HTH4_ROMCU
MPANFNLLDLYTKDSKCPAFSQYYVLEPQVAMDYRNNQPLEKELKATILGDKGQPLKEIFQSKNNNLALFSNKYCIFDLL